MPLLVWYIKIFSVVFKIPKKLNFEAINVLGRAGRRLPLDLSRQLSRQETSCTAARWSKAHGILRSFDQFANAVLEEACERVIVGDLYCDIPLGLYIIRGENVVLIGELDLEREELPPHMTRVSEAEIKRAQKAEREATDLKGTMRKRMEFLDLD
ncbi:hypothetical protein I3842_Q127300 [Carya illinoinensis]|uniref:U6 snRNA-associated Sm-like protein LSm1 n=1 Tax=Carya illinoinensis TaxID=32201 RepID=A0A921ZXM9_CARIL|nr:hypothetical protein I3842_Q127300 [Carya illinoinensis]